MAKTNPIGVRFDETMLDVFKKDGIADSPQKALNFLYQFYLENTQEKKDKLDVKKQVSSNKSKVHSEYNFEDAPWLSLEKYTEYPKNQRPANWVEQLKWDKLKKESDQKIIEAWPLFKNELKKQLK